MPFVIFDLTTESHELTNLTPTHLTHFLQISSELFLKRETGIIPIENDGYLDFQFSLMSKDLQDGIKSLFKTKHFTNPFLFIQSNNKTCKADLFLVEEVYIHSSVQIKTSNGWISFMLKLKSVMKSNQSLENSILDSKPELAPKQEWRTVYTINYFPKSYIKEDRSFSRRLRPAGPYNSCFLWDTAGEFFREKMIFNNKTISMLDVLKNSIQYEHYYPELKQVCKFEIEQFLNDKTTDLSNLSSCFIRNYFNEAKKEDLIDNIFKFKDFDSTRKTHIFITYLLGYWFYQNNLSLKNAIDRTTEQHVAPKGISPNEPSRIQGAKDRFLYVWFLTSLGHDLAHNEDIKDQEIQNLEWPPIEHSCVPNEYSIQNMEKYATMRLKNNKREHGIHGGKSLYTFLKKIFVEKQGESNAYSSWNLKYLNHDISIASWAIISHNIWFSGDTDTDRAYEHIPDFQSEKGPYINLEEHPFLYLLCLVDTIEPTKRISPDNPNDVFTELSRLTITIKNDSLEISKIIPDVSRWLQIRNTSTNLQIQKG